jgi:cytidylate kinase
MACTRRIEREPHWRCQQQQQLVVECELVAQLVRRGSFLQLLVEQGTRIQVSRIFNQEAWEVSPAKQKKQMSFFKNTNSSTLKPMQKNKKLEARQ